MTREEFETWKHSRLTQEVIRKLKKTQDYYSDQAAKACFLADSIDKVALLNANYAGICTGIAEVIDLEWEDFEYED